MPSLFETVGIDPRAFAEVGQLLTASKVLGFGVGRFAAKMPESWYEDVERGFADLPEPTLKSTKQLLRQIANRALVGVNYQFDKGIPWHENALQAINLGCIDLAVAVDDDVGVFPGLNKFLRDAEPKASENMATTLEDYESVCRRLIEVAPRCVFVDPYCDLDNHLLAASQLLMEFVRWRVAHGSVQFDLLCRANVVLPSPRRQVDVDPTKDIARRIERFYKAVEKRLLLVDLPNSVHLRIDFLDDIRGLDLHDRFVLSDRGGVQIGKGFQLPPSPVRTFASLVSAKPLEQLCRDYMDGHHGNRIEGSLFINRLPGDDQVNEWHIVVPT